MIKIENVFGKVIYQNDKVETIRKAVIEALREKVDLKGVHLTSVDLSHLNFTEVDLSCSVLELVNLRHCNFHHAILKKSQMGNINASNSIFNHCDLREMNIYNSVLNNAFFNDANLKDSRIVSSRVNKASFLCSDLENTKLYRSDLSDTYWERSNLTNTRVTFSDMQDSHLHGVTLDGTDFAQSNLSRTSFFKSYLKRVCFKGANLYSVGDLDNLSDCEIDCETQFACSICPSEGSFIGWKQVAEGKIVKLLIHADAKRSSAFSFKCRCSKATVLDIQNIDGTRCELDTVQSRRNSDFKYTRGEVIEVPDFDENRFKECSTGIHFFLSRELAVLY